MPKFSVVLIWIVGACLALGVCGVVVNIVSPAPIIGVSTPLSVPASGMAEKATVIFSGDIMLDRYIRKVGETKGYDFIFSCVAPLLATADLVVANLEGPITSSMSVSEGTVVDTPENYVFTFSTSTAPLLFKKNIRLVNIGNNHIMNFGREGLEETRHRLMEAGVSFFGDPHATEEGNIERMVLRGIPVSFVSWSDWTGNTSEETLVQVHTESTADRLVFVYAHWGDEYVPPPERVKVLARAFVDAGAEMVIGSHPHVVQELEEYAGKRIYYSLGNFIFDQYWNDAVRTGLLLKVSFSQNGVTKVEEIPIYLETDGRTCLKST